METAPATEQRRVVSENPLDYVALVLYVRRRVPACDTLVALAAKRLDVLVQDVDSIQGEKPPWLKGVPTVVTLPDRSVLQGTRAMEAVQKLCETSAQGVDGFHEGLRGCGAPAAPLSGDAQGPTPFDQLFCCPDDPGGACGDLPLPRQGDERYQDKPREKFHDTTLEEAMRRRGVSA